MSICVICKKNCSKVKIALFDGDCELIGYASRDCMNKYRVENNGKTGYEVKNK